MSHLPQSVLARITEFVNTVDDRLSQSSYHVDRAVEVHDAFDSADVDSRLFRALLCRAAIENSGNGLTVATMSMGGCEAIIHHEDVSHRFRFAKAQLDRRARLVVRVSSASALAQRLSPQLSLFDDSETVVDNESMTWLLAYRLYPTTRTFRQVAAGLPESLVGSGSPKRVEFGALYDLHLTAPAPPAFPGLDDDLDLGDDQTGNIDRTG